MDARRRGAVAALAAMVLTTLVVLGAAAPAGAATVTVCASGCDHTSIAAAVTAAAPGDTVTVAAGTYTEPQIIINKPLTLEGAGSDQTLITYSPQSSLGAIRINTAAGAISVSGLRVPTGAASGHNTGIYVVSTSDTPGPVDLDDVHILGKNGPANNESGLYLLGNANRPEPHFTFTNGQINNTHGNGLLGEDWRGGATFRDSTFIRQVNNAVLYHHMVNNNSDESYVEQTPGPWTFDGNNITGNIQLTQFNTTVTHGYGPIEVTDNVIDTPQLGGTAVFYRDRYGSSITVTGNRFTATNATPNFNGNGVLLDHQGTAVGTLNFDVSGNSFVKYTNAFQVGANRTRVGTLNHNRFQVVNGVNRASGLNVEASSNWWACNSGPAAAPCANVAGAVAFSTVTIDDWIVVSAEATPPSVPVNGNSTVSSNLNFLNTGDPVSLPPVFEGLITSYATDVGSIVPLAGTLTGGNAPDGTFTAPGVGGTATVLATIDGYTVEVPIEIVVPGIHGTVTSAEDSSPIAGIQVRLYKDGAAASSAKTTDANGQYSFPSLGTGSYELWFRDVNSGLWFSEYFEDSPTRAGATPVSFTAGDVVTIDAELEPTNFVPPPPRQTITGTVVSDVDSSPIAGIQVRLYSAADGFVSSAATTTGVDGVYTFANRIPGDYKLWFRDVNSGLWISEYHDDQPSLAVADVVTLTDSTLTVDASLAPTGFVPPPARQPISGTVTSSVDDSPIAGIQVRLYSAADGFVSSAATTTDENGNYTFANRHQGTYRLWFRDITQLSWVSEYHLDQPTLGEADDVILGNAPEVVDADLTPVG